jgi:dUTP pyrophosphatase
MKYRLTNGTAKRPEQGTVGDAGYDLFANEAIIIPPGLSALVKTGVAIEMPANYHGFIWPRSKLSSKKSIAKLAGLIDNNYRGEIHACLINHGGESLDIRVGDAIAQIVFQETLTEFEWVEVGNLSETSRGTAGITCSEMRLRHDT